VYSGVDTPPSAFYDVAHATAGADTCSTVPIATPSSLAGCTTGVLVLHQPVWACPSTKALPPSLGIVGWPQKQPLLVCNGPVEDGTNMCETVVGFTSSTSNCINTAPAGWKFVTDTEMGSGVRDRIDGGNGGCSGQCGTGKTGVGGTIVGGGF
jgi:hypothetical protein